MRRIARWLGLNGPEPYDWAIECPELRGPAEHHVHRVWPDPEPGPPPVEHEPMEGGET